MNRIRRDSDEKLSYRNADGYADPTCFYALRNIMIREKRARSAEQRKTRFVRQKRFNTQVIHYD